MKLRGFKLSEEICIAWYSLWHWNDVFFLELATKTLCPQPTQKLRRKTWFCFALDLVLPIITKFCWPITASNSINNELNRKTNRKLNLRFFVDLYEIMWSQSVMSIVNLCSLLSVKTPCYKMQNRLTRQYKWIAWSFM